MKKLFGLLCALALMFAFTTKVNARNISVADIVNQVRQDNSAFESVEANTNSSDSSKLDIMYNGGFVMSVGYVDGVMTYSDDNPSPIKDTVITNILNAVFKLQGINKTSTDFKEEIKANPSKYTYTQHKVEGTVNGNNRYSYIKLDTNNVNLGGGSSNSGSGSNSGSSTSESNPKTGVFVPVFSISILIVGSVICLIWIGKNSVFKGL